MSRPLVRGETVPLEEIVNEVKHRARLVGAEAVRRGVEIPDEVAYFIELPDDELRRLQLLDHTTYARLDAHQKRWIEMLNT